MPTRHEQIELASGKTECDLCKRGDQNSIDLAVCHRCKKVICREECCRSLRQLSQSDVQKYKVCDKCDTELDNFNLRQKILKEREKLNDEKRREEKNSELIERIQAGHEIDDEELAKEVEQKNSEL